MRIILLFVSASFFWACSVSKQLQKSATENVLRNATLQTAHVGISIYEPASGKYWFNYQGDKYFVPASNTKLATCYAAMKYLGDSLVGIRYKRFGHFLAIRPSGDPTFLNPEFSYQPVIDLIKNTGEEINVYSNNKVEPLGSGWSLNDYDQSYMAERSSFPIYGNVVWISETHIYPQKLINDTLIDSSKFFTTGGVWIKPKFFIDDVTYDTLKAVQRAPWQNKFYISNLKGIKQIPFITDNNLTAIEVLRQITHKEITWGGVFMSNLKDTILHSQPTDSLLKPMMHRSDNFFAEQSLLMVSNEHLGFMNDEKIIDTILKTDFSDLPQKPRWVDGSGLSRYNLFSPQDFVAILNKMKNEFGMPRIKNILATGGEGTISNYFVKDKGFIYAKTGTLSGVVALSGFLYTRKGKELIFSVLVNNHNGSATEVRRAVEKFIEGVRDHY